jgi:DNA-binding MarR family transcriptional regulator
VSPPVTTPPGIAFLLSQTGIAATQRLAGRLARLGLQPRHLGLLRLLDDAPPTQRELARRLGVAPSRVVALVDDLEQRGLAVRERDPADRRRHIVQLTDQGRRLLRRAMAEAAEHEKTVTAPLSVQERAHLARLLGSVAEGMGLTPGVHPGHRLR